MIHFILHIQAHAHIAYFSHNREISDKYIFHYPFGNGNHCAVWSGFICPRAYPKILEVKIHETDSEMVLAREMHSMGKRKISYRLKRLMFNPNVNWSSVYTTVMSTIATSAFEARIYSTLLLVSLLKSDPISRNFSITNHCFIILLISFSNMFICFLKNSNDFGISILFMTQTN